MTPVPSARQQLLNYLAFLKEGGQLYMEGDVASVSEVPLVKARPAAPPPAHAVPKQPKSAPPPVATPSPDLFGGMMPTTEPPLAAENELMNAPPLPREARIERLAEGARRAEACRACELGATRNRCVYGDGDPEAPILFVGEAPGEQEDNQGLPFVGPAGQLLKKMIKAIGFERGEVFICNTLKCRPPGNRDPRPEEKAACEPFLVEQLAIVRPSIIVALGAHAAQYLCRSTKSIGELRGRWHDYHGIPLRATYHPSFLLRPNGIPFKPKAWDDFQVIHARYSELHPDSPRTLWQPGGASSRSEQ